MASKKEKTGLRLSVEGTRLELSVLFQVDGGGRSGNLAKSGAGGSGFSFKMICPDHLCGVRQQYVCEKKGHAVDKKTAYAGYPVGDKMKLLTQEKVKSLRVPKVDNSIEILYLIDVAEYGWGFDPAIVRLTGNVRALVPNTTTSAASLMNKRWAALLALMQGKAAVARVMDAGSFCYALLVPAHTGAMLVHELYLPEDCYDVPLVEVPPLHEDAEKAAQVREQYLAKAEELTRAFEPASVAHDPYREMRALAVEQAEAGAAPPPEVAVAVLAVAKKEEDLLALI